MNSPLNPITVPSPVPSTQRRVSASSIPSPELFQGGQEVVIRHDGQDYRLRITRQNKLILTK